MRGPREKCSPELPQTMTALARIKTIWIYKNIRIKYKRLRALIITIFLYACETWTLTAELQRRIQSLELICLRKILGISYKDRITNEHVRKTIIKHMGLYEDLLATVKRRKLKWYGHLTRSDGLTPLSFSLSLFAQWHTTGNSRRPANKGYAEKEVDWQHCGEDRQILRRYIKSWHTPAGVERVDGEVHYDTRSYGTNAEDRQISGIRCLVCYQAEQYSNTRVHWDPSR